MFNLQLSYPEITGGEGGTPITYRVLSPELQGLILDNSRTLLEGESSTNQALLAAQDICEVALDVHGIECKPAASYEADKPLSDIADLDLSGMTTAAGQKALAARLNQISRRLNTQKEQLL